MKEYEVSVEVENELGEYSVIKRYYVLPIQERLTLKETIDELLNEDYIFNGFKIIGYNVDNY